MIAGSLGVGRLIELVPRRTRQRHQLDEVGLAILGASGGEPGGEGRLFPAPDVGAAPVDALARGIDRQPTAPQASAVRQ
jgi:hypothetical protein